jgi:hypothetical protein
MIELDSGCRMQFIKDPKTKSPYVVEICFNASWLDAKAENDAKGRTNREIQIEVRAYINEIDHVKWNTRELKGVWP